MDRRSFLRGLGAIVGGVALTEAIPLGRVWSFPSKVKIATPSEAISHQLEMLYGTIPALFEGIPYVYQDTDTGGPWMGLDRSGYVSSRAFRVPAVSRG